MTSYRLTPAAQRDFSSIWDFTEERWDVRQAETYVTEIRAAIERIADDPRRGRACDEIREGFRRYGIGSHLLFYVENADGVDVIRILHQAHGPNASPVRPARDRPLAEALRQLAAGESRFALGRPACPVVVPACRREVKMR